MKEDIKAFLEENPGFWGVESIRKACSIGHWASTLNGCLELLYYGEIEAIKTKRGWVFCKRRSSE